ncbi:YbaB/EbfC family DNA-binding protein [Nocardia panacis]|uniref:YbaB/EbfC family DNA-binding protein n=1 Tax=Nocardia panacis TaxID=2340916 RepID=A0A3A4KGN3_9NOCA|nr:YbaB/EbfC family nucleoid-associated protein [Nocardia panacis]RJO75148.1 YbaB/EbfC family DNA-binding protein [Nocardia panacis]
MDRWEREGLRAANTGTLNQVDHMLDILKEQQAYLKNVQEKMTTLRATATSTDRLVTVTVDAAGVVTEVRFDQEALRGNADELGRSVAETARQAAAAARGQVQELLAPVLESAESMPDFSDLIPDAPSMRPHVDR